RPPPPSTRRHPRPPNSNKTKPAVASLPSAPTRKRENQLRSRQERWNPHNPVSVEPGPAQTNGKAERFIRTLLGGWAYGAIYGSSAERTAALDGWLWRYNHERPHGSLGRRPPSARLAELNNLLGSYS